MKEPKAPRLVTVAIITTTTIIFWIFFTVYRIFTSAPEVNVPEELLAPITPSLNQEGLNKLEERIFFEDDEIPEFIATPSAVVEEEVEATPTPTQALLIEEEQSTPTSTAEAEPTP